LASILCFPRPQVQSASRRIVVPQFLRFRRQDLHVPAPPARRNEWP
jgi:hypothetical protein